MNKYATALSFIFGAGLGTAVTWYFLKTKYEAIAEEEIASVKETYAKHEEDRPSQTEPEAEPSEPDEATKKRLARNKPDISVYAKQIEKLKYTECFDEAEEEEPEKEQVEEEPRVIQEHPYVIPPEEFGELDDYEALTLYYFIGYPKEKVLADENFEIIENIDDVVGFDSLNHFGEYEEDSVYVRNDRLRCDYEILLDERCYDEVEIVQMRKGQNPFAEE